MRREKLYLVDKMEIADPIGMFCTGINIEVLLKEEMRQAVILKKLIVIGDAAAR